MKTRRLAVRAAVGAVIGAVVALIAASAASAHDSLEGADPAAGSTVSVLTQVALTFSAAPLGGDGADVVQIVGPDGRYYETACPTLADEVVTAPVALGAAGEYEVVWRVVSSDGHPVTGTYSFTYAPETDAAAAGAPSPVCGAAAESAAPVDAQPAAGTAVGRWIGLGIGGVVVIAAGVVVYLIVRAPRGEHPGS